MTAYNVVRFKVKPGREQEFLEAHRHLERDFPGLRRGGLIKTGDRAYCLVAEWDGMASIASARPAMIANLDRFRDTLEDLGNGLGLTDPVSGEVVVELKA
jgi:antibiotic biosynthesis monooxygenase (ABM) superfamily enzyme